MLNIITASINIKGEIEKLIVHDPDVKREKTH